MGRHLFVRTVRECGPAAIAGFALLLGLGCQSASGPPASASRHAVGAAGAYYAADCNDSDNPEAACTRPTDDIINSLKAGGYPYYIGHAEPTAEFFSKTGTSGYNMQWKFSLPATDPNPAQDGSSVANFQLYAALWVGLALCDPHSNPFGNCNAVDDTNNPATAGAAFLEMQFYPPGSPFALGSSCSNTQWCASLHINTLQNFPGSTCVEPTTAAFITTDGTPGGSKLFMNNGDSLLVTVKDTANGLETDISDLTAGTSGSMVASGANGFVHNKNTTDCSTEAFDFHPMYKTAKPGQTVPWATLSPNVAFNFEIGHFELCSDASCSPKPDGAGGEQQNCGTLRGVGGCIDSDTDHDGVCYTASWADGTAAHPASVVLGAPDDSGVGPLTAASAGSLGTYDEGYGTIKFATTEGTGGAFYPYFTQAGTGASCRFNFGNTIPGTTTNDFGKKAQYGTTIDNPCAPGQLATTLTYNGATSQDFDDVATLSATLTITDTGKGVSGASIAFAMGAQSCSGTTDGTGHASCTITVNQAPGGYTVSASFAGDSGHKASSASTGFTVNQEQSAVAYTGPVSGDFNDPVTLSANLTEDGTLALSGQTIAFTLGAQSCSGTTDASGNASCTITLTQTPGGYTVKASFAGNTYYLASSDSKSFTITKEEDSLKNTGATTSDYHDAATVSAVLTEDGVTPLAGRTLTFTLNGAETCSGVTDATGTASCSITPNEAAGNYPLTISFAGDADYLPSTSTVSFTVTKEETSVTSTSALQVIPTGFPATFSATLTEDGTTPIAGRSVTITLGSGGSAQSCTGTTDGSGVATCSITPAAGLSGPQPIADSFAGDAFYLPSTHAQQALVFSFLAKGAFVVGDKSAASGAKVTWWGAQWAKVNALSGGGAPRAFKGFADTTVEHPACGANWTTDPGNSSAPPAAALIPSYMGVIVSAHVNKSGSTVAGDTPKIVVVKTDPGYAPNPGHAGTGTVVATYCP